MTHYDEEALFNYEMGAFYTHWLDTIEEDQNSDGSVDNYVPHIDQHSGGDPIW